MMLTSPATLQYLKKRKSYPRKYAQLYNVLVLVLCSIVVHLCSPWVERNFLTPRNVSLKGRL
jgi:hypothetical protein